MPETTHSPRPAAGRRRAAEEGSLRPRHGSESRDSAGQRVLLVGSDCGGQDLRARILRDHGIDVDVAKDVGAARALWRPGVYDLVLIDLRLHWPGEVQEWCEEIRQAGSDARIAFLTGPPEYVSCDWPDCGIGDHGPQWEETVRRVSSVLDLSRRPALVP